MQNLPLQLQSSILQHQLQSWLVHFAFFSRGHFWACLHHIQKVSFKRVTINITTAPQTLALPHQKISVKDKNLIFNKAVSYLQEYIKTRPRRYKNCWIRKMTRSDRKHFDLLMAVLDWLTVEMKQLRRFAPCCGLPHVSSSILKIIFLFNRRQFNWFFSISNLAPAAWM